MVVWFVQVLARLIVSYSFGEGGWGKRKEGVSRDVSNFWSVGYADTVS